jgi:hypothetical protein
MDDAGSMRYVKRLGNLNRILKGLVERERTFLQAIGRRLPFQTLHHQEVGAVLVPDVVECADVRMVERCDGSGFTLEPLTASGIGSNVRRENLDCNCATQAGVAGFVYLTHAPCANGAEDFIRAEATSGCQRHF